MDYATLSKIEDLRNAKVEALKLISEEGYQRMRIALIRQCTRETKELTVNSLLTVATNYKELAVDAKVGLVAAAVAGEFLTEAEEDKEDKEDKEEVKLHKTLYGQQRSKRGFGHKLVVSAVNYQAVENFDPIAQRHHRASLILSHFMGTGRLSGSCIWYKIKGMTSIQVCKLIVQTTEWLEKEGDVLNEDKLIKWLKSKARTSPYKNIS